MTNPLRDKPGISIYRVDFSGPSQIAGRAIEVSTLIWIAASADASRYAQRIGRSYRRRQGGVCSKGVGIVSGNE